MPNEIIEAIVAFILNWANQYPTVAAVIMVIGTLRLLMKPLFTFLNEVVLITPGQWDNELLQKVETSKVYKTILWILDWFASVKIPVRGK